MTETFDFLGRDKYEKKENVAAEAFIEDQVVSQIELFNRQQIDREIDKQVDG